MFKYKPFTVFFILSLAAVLTFLSSFLVSSGIDRKFSSKIPILATVELSEENTFAVYEYEKTTYRTPLTYSSALRNGTKMPIYIDKDSPSEIHIKNLTSVYILRFLSLPIFFICIIATAVSFVKYKKLTEKNK